MGRHAAGWMPKPACRAELLRERGSGAVRAGCGAGPERASREPRPRRASPRQPAAFAAAFAAAALYATATRATERR